MFILASDIEPQSPSKLSIEVVMNEPCKDYKTRMQRAVESPRVDVSSNEDLRRKSALSLTLCFHVQQKSFSEDAGKPLY
jgi:hypothetical protein